MTDRELMQQALEALSPWAGEDANHTEQYAAYQALRERLAQHTTRIVTDANGRKYITNEPRLRE